MSAAPASSAESTACVSRGRRSQQTAILAPGQNITRNRSASPEIGGLCQAPVPPPSAKSGITFQSNPDISFNSALNAYLLVFQSDDGFFYATSSDMTSWSPPRLFMSTPPNLQGLRTPGAEYYYYPLLVTPSAPSDQLTGADGFIFYAKGTQDARLTQSNHSWYRRSWSIR